jgi:hypothetical protein
MPEHLIVARPRVRICDPASGIARARASPQPGALTIDLRRKQWRLRSDA